MSNNIYDAVTFNATQLHKEQLASDVEQCRARLDRARKLLGGLGGEKQRWMETVEQLDTDYTNLVGDALVSSATDPITDPVLARLNKLPGKFGFM